MSPADNIEENTEPVPIDVTVNGSPRSVQAHSDTPLLYVLRNDLGLKGTRFGCGSNQCGACFVLRDGRAVPACDTPLWSVGAAEITTVEALGETRIGAELQEAFLAEQAGQCGYCLSGMLIAATALLGPNPDPSEVEVRAALDANLCRCGSHNRIVRAVLLAAASLSRK